MKTRLADFDSLTPAEERLRDEIGLGGVVVFGDGDLPPQDAGPDRQITAAFLRYLCRGGCDAVPAPVPDTGVQIRGARITGTLDLEGARCPRDISLIACRIDAAPILLSAEIDGLFLDGSALPGLVADRLTTRGGVFLHGATATGETRLLGAKIGGNLSCNGATLTAGESGTALSADGLRAEGGVFLRGATASGEIWLPGARIGGDLDCTVATLTAGESGRALSADGLRAEGSVFLRGVSATGEIGLPGARIVGDLSCTGATLIAGKSGKALNASVAQVTGSFFLRDGARIDGVLDLTAARLGTITDTAACWPAPGNLILDRCDYGAFTGTDITAEARIQWLGLQDWTSWGHDFWPQPWEHCAKVLREMGHTEDARAVLIDKEWRQRRWQRERIAARLAGARLRLRLERMRPDQDDAEALLKDVEARHEGLQPGDIRRRDIDSQIERAGPVAEQIVAEKVDDKEAFAERLAPRLDRLGLQGVDPVMAARSAVVDAWTALQLARLQDAILRYSVAYGRRPARAVGWLVGAWLLGALLYGIAWGDRAFKPNNSFVLRAPEWAFCAPSYEGTQTAPSRYVEGVHDSQLDCFLDQPEAQGHPQFNALVYSLDTLLPIVAMEMQEHWIPDEGTGTRGWMTRAYLWLHIALGWALSLLAVAGFSGLIKSD